MDFERLALYERILAALPAVEKPAFAAYEDGWLSARRSRCPMYDDRVDKTCLREAIDDHIAELAALDGQSSGATTRLRFRSRRKTDVNPNVDIHATYVEFERAQTPAERLFNEQVMKLVDRLPFSQSIDPKTTSTWQDTIDVRSIYRSPRLIGVKFAEWVCCGAYGSGGFYSVNIDAANGTVLVPERWFHLDEVAAACWYQFVDGNKGGEAFRHLYPLREAIERFSENLRRPSIWSFSQRGVELQFSALMGYASGPYTCQLGYSELAKSTVAGFRLPP
ncbi:MAG: hypothetical protein KIS73_08750 [Enhydrobacter sp.]|nr:hypothetical protein [Enhydrobacter sp.]